jgi:nucleoside-diphosphate-sugar epimerase
MTLTNMNQLENTMKILFLGGTGNISWHCVHESIKAGHDVWVINRGETTSTRRMLPSSAKLLKADIRNAEDVSNKIGKHHFDVVCDFIGYTGEHALSNINLFRERTSHYLYISSVVVYERKTQYLPFKENTKQWDITDYDYATGKIISEKVYMEAYKSFGFPVTIVRPAHTYDTIIPAPLGHNCYTAPQRYLQNKPVLIAGDGTNLWTLTHSSDFATAFVGLFGNTNSIGEDFHITSDEWLTWLDITEILLSELGVKSPQLLHIPVHEILEMKVPESKNMAISYLGKAFRGQRMWCDIYDNAKIKRFVPGWAAKVSFRDGIKQTLEWLNSDSVRKRINPELDSLLENLTQKYSN